MKLRYCCIILWIFIFNSCYKNNKPVQINFYYWNTIFLLNDSEQKFLEEVPTKKMYVKYFDLAFNPNTKKTEYRAEVDFKTSPKQLIIPCVFITNSTFNHVKDVESLAKEVYSKINHINSQTAIKIREIQIDCDWTSSTQKRYFVFLKHLKKHAEKDQLAISTTIRLHQIKYKDKTGVPPVEKGYLMCYNMGDIENVKESNSIYQEALLKDYTSTINDYPISLNLAIPLYSWGLVYRFGKLVEIMNNLTEEDLKLQKRQGKNRFLIEENQYLKNSYLYKGDQIRIERTSLENTKNGIQWLYDRMEHKPEELLFYHLKSNLIQSYDSKDFKEYIHF